VMYAVNLNHTLKKQPNAEEISAIR